MTAVSLVLRSLLEDLADGCINSYRSIADSPKPVPSPVIPPMGTLATLDCGNLLVVGATSVTSAFQGPGERCAIAMQANLSVTVTRCVENLTDFGRPATQAALTEDGLLLAQDVSTLWYGLTGQCQQGLLWKSFADLDCGSTRFRDMRPGASGGIAWFTWQISVDLATSLLAGNDPIVWTTGETIDWTSLESIDWTT